MSIDRTEAGCRQKLVGEDAQVFAGARQSRRRGKNCFDTSLAGEATNGLRECLTLLIFLTSEPIRTDETQARDPKDAEHNGISQIQNTGKANFDASP